MTSVSFITDLFLANSYLQTIIYTHYTGYPIWNLNKANGRSLQL